MIQKIFKACSLLVTLSSVTLLASQASAQTAVAASPAAATPTPIKSAFEGYQAYSDDQISNWKAANDDVARIGGWREYAKQAQGLEIKPENTPSSAARPGDGKPKATP